MSESSLSPQTARDLVVQAWRAVHGRDPTTGEAAYTQAVAFLENRYGRAGQFAQFIAQGGYNWGALERARNADGGCSDGWMAGVDAGNPRCFRVYPSDLAAATAYVANLTKSFPTRAARILAAMNGGTAADVASAMKSTPAYFEADPVTYGKAIDNALAAMRTANVPTPSPAQAAAAGRGLLLFAALCAAGYAYHARPDLVRRIPFVGRRLA